VGEERPPGGRGLATAASVTAPSTPVPPAPGHGDDAIWEGNNPLWGERAGKRTGGEGTSPWGNARPRNPQKATISASVLS